MKLIATSLLFTLSLTLPANADDGTKQDWFEKLGEGFSGELKENLLEQFQDLAEEMKPLMEDLSQRFDGVTGYHPPEVLPNGDIIIRRKENQNPPNDVIEDAEGGTIEL